MQISAFLVIAGAAVVAAKFQPKGHEQINDPKNLAQLQADAQGWVAGHNHFFGNKTYNDVRGLMGTSLLFDNNFVHEALPDEHYAKLNATAIPAEFDARTQWPGLIHPIRDQQQCGSCWAFSASEVLSDRFSIASGKKAPVLSPQDMVSCDSGDMGCNGGQLANAWTYLAGTGIVTDSCLPYTAGTGTSGTCGNKCVDSESWTSSKHKAAKAYTIKGVENMQKEIMTNGPIQVAFYVYSSFMSYKSGVYQKLWYELIPEGGHAVKIVGWGTEGGKDYWLVANSWNTSWGLDGFFKIQRGTNQCYIESAGPPYAGNPEL